MRDDHNHLLFIPLHMRPQSRIGPENTLASIGFCEIIDIVEKRL